MRGYEPTSCIDRLPTSIVRFGYARADVTPPVGIYHRMWGAARHDRSTGLHRPILAETLIFQSASDSTDAAPFLRVLLDMVGLSIDQESTLQERIAERVGLAADRIAVSYSHTHSGGLFLPDRIDLAGGELIPGYIEEMQGAVADACAEAMRNVRPVAISYAESTCTMAANRDFRDTERDIFVTGYNPLDKAMHPVRVGLVSDESGQRIHSFVHYACHPTTLAWDNTLISPDFAGAMRDTVESVTSAPCSYLQAPCGNIGPRDGFCGDTEVADRNGRQLAYAALSALESIAAPLHDFCYAGPVVSGATLGAWEHRPFSDARRREAEIFEARSSRVELDCRELPGRAEFELDRDKWERACAEAEAGGRDADARDADAHAERARRWLARIDETPPGGQRAMPYSVLRMGDAVWVTCGGEPDSLLQDELSRRHPEYQVLVSSIATEMWLAYLLPRERYGMGLYQEEPSILAPGTLETLIDTIDGTIGSML